MQASAGMSSLRRPVGKGLGFIPDEAVHYGFASLTASYRFHAHAHARVGMT